MIPLKFDEDGNLENHKEFFEGQEWVDVPAECACCCTSYRTGKDACIKESDKVFIYESEYRVYLTFHGPVKIIERSGCGTYRPRYDLVPTLESKIVISKAKPTDAKPNYGFFNADYIRITHEHRTASLEEDVTKEIFKKHKNC